jgi:hypothetical protein
VLFASTPLRLLNSCIVLAAIYPVFLWLLVFRYRRTWPGVLIAVIGTTLVWFIADLIAFLGNETNNGGPAIFANLIRGEMVFIGVVSAWLCSMRRKPDHPHCPYCRYDLSGHTAALPRICPECGQSLPPLRPSVPDQPVEHPQHQHQGGEHPDQQGPQPTELPR